MPETAAKQQVSDEAKVGEGPAGRAVERTFGDAAAPKLKEKH